MKKKRLAVIFVFSERKTKMTFIQGKAPNVLTAVAYAAGRPVRSAGRLVARLI